MDSKLFRLSGYMVVFSVLALFLGCNQVTGQAVEPPAAKASGSDPSAPAENQENMSKRFKGTVVEVIDAGRHIYIQIDTGGKLVWVAAPTFDGKSGDSVIVPPGVPSADFHSKTLNRDFEMIYFVGGIQRVDENAADQPMGALPTDNQADALPAGNQMAHPSMDELAGGLVIDVGKVEKAKGGKTVFEIITDRKNLAGREIWVRAKVVKNAADIMGKNWLHVRDGSGDENTNDLIVSTNTVVNVGDVVLVRGIVSVDRDFGFGINYSVIIEDAEVTAE